jgi:ribosomal protein L7/L12
MGRRTLMDGSSHQDLERRVAVLEQQVAMLLGQSQSAWDQPSPATSISDSDAELCRMVAGGKTIAAIKRARELYDLGLREAKDYVERLPDLR